jgi:hypothetical protein
MALRVPSLEVPFRSFKLALEGAALHKITEYLHKIVSERLCLPSCVGDHLPIVQKPCLHLCARDNAAADKLKAFTEEHRAAAVATVARGLSKSWVSGACSGFSPKA